MMTTPSILSVTVSATPTILMASASELTTIFPMIIDWASTKQKSNQPQLHLSTTSMVPPLGTLSSPVSLTSILSCILDLGIYWNTIEHELLVYMLLKFLKLK